MGQLSWISASCTRPTWALQQCPHPPASPHPTPRSLLMFTMENCFYLLISQAMRYLRDSAVHPRDKQRMKQELSSELVGGVEGPACQGDPGVSAPQCLGLP